jgi:hypothetical protein
MLATVTALVVGKAMLVANKVALLRLYDLTPLICFVPHRAYVPAHSPLHLDRTTHRIDHALELRQEAVAGVLDDPAPVLRDLRIDQLAEVALEPLVCPFFIHSHQARVARHISGEDSGEAADRGHGMSGGGSA